jgi:hypothetical protein
VNLTQINDGGGQPVYCSPNGLRGRAASTMSVLYAPQPATLTYNERINPKRQDFSA